MLNDYSFGATGHIGNTGITGSTEGFVEPSFGEAAQNGLTSTIDSLDSKNESLHSTGIFTIIKDGECRPKCLPKQAPSFTTENISTVKYNALWYYSDFYGVRSAHAISEHPETLLSLHEEKIQNPDSCWHNYSYSVSEIKVEPIECYTYNELLQKIEPYNDSDKKENHDFYAFNTLFRYDNFGISFYDDIDMKIVDSDGELLDSDDYDMDKGEILIYLSKKCRDLWEKCSELYNKSEDKENFVKNPDLPEIFYTNWPSDLPVETDVYYEEGIMKA